MAKDVQMQVIVAQKKMGSGNVLGSLQTSLNQI